MTHRFTVIGVIAVLAALAVIFRLHRLQVREHERWADLAADQQGGISALPGERGRILDCTGKVLAEDEAVLDVLVEPSTFREQSLIHALADALVLGTRAAPAAEVQWRCFTNPGKAVQELATAAFPDAPLLVERMQTLVPPQGTLPRRMDEGSARWKRCFRLLGVAVPDPTARAAWLEREGPGLAARCAEELRLLSELARLRGADLPALLGELAELTQREEIWKQGQVRRELREAAALDAFGVPAPGWRELGGAAWREILSRAGLPFTEEADAAHAAASADAWLSGCIVLPFSLPAVSSEADAVELARGAQLFAQDGDAALDHWAATVGLAAMDPELLRRRERDLGARWRRGRSFPCATALPLAARTLFVGPGRLERTGFRIECRLTRRALPETAETRTLGLLLGAVARKTGEPIMARSVEADRNDILRSAPGVVAGGVPGGLVIEAPRHGRELRLTLDWALQQGVEQALDVAHAREPMALVLMDPATGAIRALVTAPLGGNRADAYRKRLELEEERTLLRRILGRGDGWARQRLLSLRAAPGHESECGLIERWQGAAPASLRQRLDVVGESLAMSPAFHRAVDIPEHLPPGSVFKALTVLAALDQGKMQEDAAVVCEHTSERTFLRCKGHGHVAARGALKVSCNAWCYEAGARLGSRTLIDWYRRFGLGEPVPGLLGRDERLFQDLAADDARALAIGGGSLRVAPVRAAAIAASLATGRRVLATLVSGDGKALPALGVRPAALDLVRLGMRDVVRPGGTAAAVAGLQPFRMAAKTGTADYEASSGERLNQAWFVGWAPADPGETPRIAFAAVRAHTHDKGADAAPLVAAALEALVRVHPEERWW